MSTQGKRNSGRGHSLATQQQFTEETLCPGVCWEMFTNQRGGGERSARFWAVNPPANFKLSICSH